MTIQPRLLQTTAVLAAISLSCSNCANTQDGRLTQAQGTGLGALAGGALGAGIGALTGDSRNVARGAIIGAAIGTAAGFGYGTHVANQKAKYASVEAWLDACIADARAKRSAATAYNQRLGRELTRLQREVASARAAGDKSRLKSLKSEIQRERKAAEKETDGFRKESELQRGAIQQAGGKGGSRLSSLRSTASGIDTQVSIMNKNTQRMAALESQTDV